jgi:two-component system cell cycle sensor histidine kinase/response regulator CckA
MLGMTMPQVTHPDDLAESLERREGLLAGEARHFRQEMRYVRRDGRVLTALTSVSLVRDAVGRPRLYVGQVQDITERRAAEAQRDALLRRLQLQIERMPLAHVLLDANGRVADWNPAAGSLFRYRKDEIVGDGPPYPKFVPESFRPQSEALLGRIRGGDMAAHSVNDNLTKDGRTITCEWFNTPLMTDDGRFDGLFCLAQDVTERRRLEEQLRQAQKMEAVGQLAGGVAHDFNNLLTVINGFAEMLEGDPAVPGPAREMVRQVHRAGDRAAALTRLLLTFSRKQVLEPRVLDLNELVRETARMLRRLLPADIDLAADLAAGLGRIKADPGQVEQVLMNLVVNARDAMPAGGKLTVGTRDVELGEEYARGHLGVRPGAYVRLSVTDTGVGMDAATRARIFEPFFTTKPVGQGTGLGLSTVFGIVLQSGGHVEVYSEPGRGTTFKVYLPRLAGEVAAEVAATVLAVPRGSEAVLVAEDDEGIRGLARAALEACGYAVLEAADGAAALALGESHVGRIDMLVCDVVMPKGGGRELAERLREVRPGLRVLYVSGYADEAVTRHGVVAEGVPRRRVRDCGVVVGGGTEGRVGGVRLVCPAGHTLFVHQTWVA